MGIPEAKAGLEGGSVDVALLAGAAAYQTQQQGYHLITDGEGLINAIIAVAVTNKFYEAHPEIIEKLQSAQAEIADFMQNHEQEAYEMAAAELDLDVDAVKKWRSIMTSPQRLLLRIRMASSAPLILCIRQA